MLLGHLLPHGGEMAAEAPDQTSSDRALVGEYKHLFAHLVLFCSQEIPCPFWQKVML